LLAQQVVAEFSGRVRFAVEDFGDSPLAERFGVDKYPAVFVGDALVARPEDFYGWGTQATGRYVPFDSVKRRRAFQQDLRRMIQVSLDGGTLVSRPASGATARVVLPALKLRDIEGNRFTLRGSGGRPMLIEVWATWCPPCLKTLAWLGENPPEGVDVVALAVDSPSADVAAAARRLHIPGRVAMATKDVVAALGGVPAIPTLLVVDRDGTVVRSFYGAAPDLHEELTREIGRLQSAAGSPER
jgi:thiol-disulfide isomerase/thioredoxin